MTDQTALVYAIGLEARGYAAEASELRRLSAIEDEWARLSQDDGKAERAIARLSTVNATLLEALNIIAGNRPCVDTLMGDADIARAAIARAEE